MHMQEHQERNDPQGHSWREQHGGGGQQEDGCRKRGLQRREVRAEDKGDDRRVYEKGVIGNVGLAAPPIKVRGGRVGLCRGDWRRGLEGMQD